MKTALVTGSNRGIGAVTARLLRDAGWSVIAPTRKELDLMDYKSAGSLTASLDALDALILNAGEWYSRPLYEQWPHHLYDAFTLNVVSNAQMIQCALDTLRARAGVVVGVSSMRGLVGGVSTMPYSVAKAGLITLLLGYAKEYPGVRFNAVCPGWTDTDMGEIVKATGGVSNPNATPQPPAAVAQAILDLIQGDANGHVVKVVDGKAERVAWQVVHE